MKLQYAKGAESSRINKGLKRHRAGPQLPWLSARQYAIFFLRITQRFDGWQNMHAGEREVKKALRKMLVKYKLHQDQELFGGHKDISGNTTEVRSFNAP